MASVTFSSCFDSTGERVLGHILRLGDAVLLLDAGWTSEFRREDLAELEKALTDIDAAVISSSSVASLGALPVLLAQQSAAFPVYITGASHKMGQMELYEHYLALSSRTEFGEYDLNHVDAAFEALQVVNFLQRAEFEAKGERVTVTAYPAGHLVGAAVWCIEWRHEVVIYGPVFNHRKDRHLPSAHLAAISPRPLVVISHVDRALQVRPPPAHQDSEFFAAVQAVLRSGGSVLIPVDTAGRVLELLLLLDKHWAQRRLPYPLVWLSSMASSTLEFAKSSTEWMLDTLLWQGPHMRDNPFNLRRVVLCSSVQELDRLPPGPRLVLASGADLGQSLARDLLPGFIDNPSSAIVLPWHRQNGDAKEANSDVHATIPLMSQLETATSGTTLQFSISSRIPLEGAELEAALEERQRAAQQQITGPEADEAPHVTRTNTETIRQASFSVASDEHDRLNDDVVTPRQGKTSNGKARQNNVDCLTDGFQVPEGASAPMFPFPTDPPAHDAYGAIEEIPLEADLISKPGFYEPDEEKEESAPKDDEVEDLPTKVVVRDVKMTCRAKILKFSYEGIVDAKSIRVILNQSGPRHCILVGHSTKYGDAMRGLQHQLATDLASLRSVIHLGPGAGSRLGIVPDPVVSVETDESFLSTLDMHAVGGNRLAWVSGRLSEAGPHALQPVKLGDPSMQSGGVFIGDVKLSEIRSALLKAKISSEFSGGALYCEGPLVIRRSSDDSETGLMLEGPLSEQFYRVQDIIYTQYHVC